MAQRMLTTVCVTIFFGAVALSAPPEPPNGNADDCKEGDQECKMSPNEVASSTILQRSSSNAFSATIDMTEADGAGTWSASPFGECCGEGTNKDMRFREVKCVDHLTNADAEDESACTGPKPENYEQCDCGEGFADVCDSTACSMQKEDAVGISSNDHFAKVGCFEGDAPTPEDTPDYHISIEDWACMTAKTEGPCQYGLPFYQKPVGSDKECAHFCIGKSMDIFGVYTKDGKKQCRCGASKANTDIWSHKSNDDRAGLFFDINSKHLKAATGQSCSLAIYRYTGAIIDGAVPHHLVTDLNEPDDEYIDSIVVGKMIGEGVEEDGHPFGQPIFDNTDTDGNNEPDGPSMVGVDQYQAQPKWTRKCWPSKCGPTRLFPDRQTQKPAKDAKEFVEYVIVRYMFKAGTDATRKQVMREAVKIWREKTCIHLIEVTDKSTLPVVVVGLWDTSYCGASLGYSLSHEGKYDTGEHHFINMGWCNSESHVSTLVHEIGHVFGMDHEQKRADAGSAYEGKPAHLKINWNNIASDWVPQWTPDMNAYMGSANDGTGDPYQGYAPYDFKSIMHYPAGNEISETIPAGHKWELGQRTTLTEGDIAQMLDMYQCKAMQECKDKQSTANCNHWVGLGYCTKTYVSYMADNCKSSCGRCSKACDETLTGVKDAGYRGCQDHTRDGLVCQKWSSQSPNAHSNTPAAKSSFGVGDHNYCRNPDGDSTIWCYTLSTTRWQTCVPKATP